MHPLHEHLAKLGETSYTLANLEYGVMTPKDSGIAEIFVELLNDMTVKPEKDGRFARTKTGIGARVQRPGYPAGYAKGMSRQVGERMMQP